MIESVQCQPYLAQIMTQRYGKNLTKGANKWLRFNVGRRDALRRRKAGVFLSGAPSAERVGAASMARKVMHARVAAISTW
jgi:hypothetical protein